MRKINVAAAQMGPIPSDIAGNIDAKKMNDSLINGSSNQKNDAKQKLLNLDIDQILILTKWDFVRFS